MNKDTFQQDILIHKDRLYRLAVSILRNPVLAKDVVQEVLIKIWQKRAELNQVQNMEAWLLRSTRNQAIDMLRSQRHQTDTLDAAQHVEANQKNPEGALVQKDESRQVKRWINQLPEKQRLIIQLRDIEGLSYQEIASVMDETVDWVKVNLFRARKKLKTIILEAYAKSAIIR